VKGSCPRDARERIVRNPRARDACGQLSSHRYLQGLVAAEGRAMIPKDEKARRGAEKGMWMISSAAEAFRPGGAAPFLMSCRRIREDLLGIGGDREPGDVQ
jgi:hypothetical protein